MPAALFQLVLRTTIRFLLRKELMFGVQDETWQVLPNHSSLHCILCTTLCSFSRGRVNWLDLRLR